MKNKQFTIAYNPTLFRWSAAIPIILNPLLIFSDPPFFDPKLKNIYIFGRLIIELVFFITFFSSFVNQKKWHLTLFYIGMIAYAVFGQFFLPGYYLAYMETVIPIGLFLPLKGKNFYLITLVGAFAMLYSINFSGTSYSPSDILISQKFHLDSSLGVLITTILSILGFHFITKVRQEKDILSAKFLDIGQNTSSLIHDFKGLLSTPMMYIQMLDKIKENYDNKTKDLITNLNEDFVYLNNYIHETNHLNNLKDYKDNFEFNEVLYSLKIVMKSSLRGVTLNVEENPKFNFSKNLLLKVLYNIFINCIESQKEKNNLEINITFDKKTSSIFIQDNGCGFSSEIIKELNSNNSVNSTKSAGSGIGTLIVRNLINSTGGSVIFSNNKNHEACVQIKLPKHSF